MFNAPRTGSRYGVSTNSFGGSFVAGENPLAQSTFEGLDPWSATPSPDPPPAPHAVPSTFTSVIGDATVPGVYYRAYDAVDPGNTGETSVNALSRALGTSSLSASTIDRIVNLVSSRPRVSKIEFFIALALVALAQAGKDLSIEQVAALAQHDNLPVPTLDIDALRASSLASPTNFRRTNSGTDPGLVRSPAPPYSADDPWGFTRHPSGSGAGVGATNGTSALDGTGLPKDWWTRQEKVNVTILGQQGFILNRYMVYEITAANGNPVPRRYSEFVFLWDCLVRRYPFRILPQLPPKRVGADVTFIEQRRKGLSRFLNFVINHPVLKEDGLLAVFLSEPSLETWRRQTSISLEEEALSKRVDRVEEMSIPGDLEEKLAIMRGKITQLIEHWQKICLLTERLGRRREAAAVRNTHALFKRSFLSAYLAHSVSVNSPLSSSTPSSPTSSTHNDASSMVSPILSPPAPSLSASFFGSMPSLPTAPLIGSARPDGAADGGFYTSRWADPQADMSRLTMTLNALNEVNHQCWRGELCELCAGVRKGLEHMSGHVGRQSDELEQRTRVMMETTLEAAKSQRDLYIAVRDLFVRHDRLSGDLVEKLKKRIESSQMKLEGIRTGQKEGWQGEFEKVQSSIERDQATIAQQLNRRVFIRACLWHELRVVLHNRENALVSLAVQEFAREESRFAETASSNWQTFVDDVEDMPYE